MPVSKLQYRRCVCRDRVKHRIENTKFEAKDYQNACSRFLRSKEIGLVSVGGDNNGMGSFQLVCLEIQQPVFSR